MLSKLYKPLPNICVCLTPNVLNVLNVYYFKNNNGLNSTDLNFDKVGIYIN